MPKHITNTSKIAPLRSAGPPYAALQSALYVGVMPRSEYMKLIKLAVLSLVLQWSASHANDSSLVLKDIDVGCLSVLSQLGEFIGEEAIQELSSSATGHSMPRYLEHCRKIAVGVSEHIYNGTVSNLEMTVDGKQLQTNKSAKMPYIDLLDIFGKEKSNPSLFARLDGQCPVVVSKSEPPQNSPENCRMGCLYYYIRAQSPEFYLGFNAGWQLHFQSWRAKENGERYFSELKKCTDPRSPGDLTSCAAFYCPTVHATISKFKSTH